MRLLAALAVARFARAEFVLLEPQTFQPNFVEGWPVSCQRGSCQPPARLQRPATPAA